MPDTLKPLGMTPEQMTAVLLNFSATLEAFARRVPRERVALSVLVANVAAAVGEMAVEVGGGDEDIATEIITSTARLVSTIRKVVEGPVGGAVIH